MLTGTWRNDREKTIICLDSYCSGVPKGRIYSLDREVGTFGSLSQLLIKMEALLDETRTPQSYTQTRSFSQPAELAERQASPFHIRKGALATFEVQVIFRQHTSWQGVLVWLDRHLEQSFRSVLELVVLMDSALRPERGCDSA